MYRKILASLAFCAVGTASAANIHAICQVDCQPGSAEDNEVNRILTENASIPSGSTVTIRDRRLEQGRYYYYVVWMKQPDGSFVAASEGSMQVAGGGGDEGGYAPFAGGGYIAFGSEGTTFRPVVTIGDILPP